MNVFERRQNDDVNPRRNGEKKRTGDVRERVQEHSNGRFKTRSDPKRPPSLKQPNRKSSFDYYFYWTVSTENAKTKPTKKENQIETVCNVLWQIYLPKISSIFFACLHRSWTFFMRTPFVSDVCVWVRIGFSLMSMYYEWDKCTFVWNSTKGRIFGEQKRSLQSVAMRSLWIAFDLNGKHWIWL